MENIFALAVLDQHSSCAEISMRAASRVRAVIPAAITASVKGTGLSAAGPVFGRYGTETLTNQANQLVSSTQTTQTGMAIPSGHPTWSPPV